MTLRFALIWLGGHALAPAAVFSLGLLSNHVLGKTDLDPPGAAFFALPLILGLFQAVILRAKVRVWLWPLLTVAGFFGAYLFSWFFIPAMGLTIGLFQSFAFHPRTSLRFGAAWTLSSGGGWLAGLLAGGEISSGGPAQSLILFTAATFGYAVALVPSLRRLLRPEN